MKFRIVTLDEEFIALNNSVSHPWGAVEKAALFHVLMLLPFYSAHLPKLQLFCILPWARLDECPEENSNSGKSW